jgi:nitrate reductase NapE component
VTAPESPADHRARQAREKRDERQMWLWLAYFLFGIHIVALVMIYAVMHAK